jgi:hypothetical protein
MERIKNSFGILCRQSNAGIADRNQELIVLIQSGRDRHLAPAVFVPDFLRLQTKRAEEEPLLEENSPVDGQNAL